MLRRLIWSGIPLTACELTSLPPILSADQS